MFTPSERRGIVVVAVLLMLGTAHDLWRARPGLAPRPFVAAVRDSVSAPTTARPVASPASSEEPQSDVVSVDLNRAGPRELEELPGIGPVIAGRIIAHRDRHGSFQRVEDLLAVRGIGPRLLARLGGLVTVAP